MLSVTALNTEYHGGRRPHRAAAQDVTFDVPEGKLFTLLGPSGCGKTTTLRSIAGLERPRAGEIAVDGRVVYSSATRDLRRAQPAQFRHGVPVLRHLAAHDRVPERRLSAGGAARQRFAAARSRDKVMRVLDAVGARRPRGARGDQALRRPAAAPGAGARPGDGAASCCCSTSRCPISTPSCASACASS